MTIFKKVFNNQMAAAQGQPLPDPNWPPLKPKVEEDASHPEPEAQDQPFAEDVLENADPVEEQMEEPPVEDDFERMASVAERAAQASRAMAATPEPMVDAEDGPEPMLQSPDMPDVVETPCVVSPEPPLPIKATSDMSTDTAAPPRIEPQAPEPDAQPLRRPATRNRTRIIGFNRGTDPAADPIEKAGQSTETGDQDFPTGWVVVTDGPGRGKFFPVYSSAAMIGRGEDQAIRLDFGDSAISRHNHAAIAYDPDSGKFYVGHGGKSNIIRLNGKPLLSTEVLEHGAVLRIGETRLRFVALCDEAFNWSEATDG